MGWLGRLFDVRDSWVRIILLNLSGVGYLVFGRHEQGPPPLAQWVLALLAFAAVLVLHRRPPLALFAQVVLLVLAFRLVDDATVNQVGTAWMLFELALWASRRWLVWAGAALVVAVYAAFSIGDSLADVAATAYGIVATVGLPLLLGLVVRAHRQLAQQALEQAAEQQRRRESEERAARAAERTTIARELHDVVAHHVASMVLRIGVARHVLPDVEPQVAEVFDDVHRTGVTALTDLRRLVAVLRGADDGDDEAALTAIEPAALPAALGAAVDTATRAGLTVAARVGPEVGALDAVRGLAVLRLTQEALTNVAKHAGKSAHATLRVSVDDRAVEWEVSDDGGRGRIDVPPGGGHGLTGMRERVEVLGGTLEAGPHGSGWRVRTRLPAPDVERVA